MRILFPNKMQDASGPAIFIDRDGVVNCRRPNDYVLEWPQFIFMAGIREALRELSTLQLPMIMISNQAAVGKGLLTPSALEEITARMNQTLIMDGVFLTAAYFCTHTPDQHCICRKPQPELLYRAAADFGVDLARSIFIGDSDTDVQAARSAGCQPVLFGAGLNSCSDSPDWMRGLPVARTAKELFQVAARVLESTNPAPIGWSSFQD